MLSIQTLCFIFIISLQIFGIVFNYSILALLTIYSLETLGSTLYYANLLEPVSFHIFGIDFNYDTLALLTIYSSEIWGQRPTMWARLNLLHVRYVLLDLLCHCMQYAWDVKSTICHCMAYAWNLRKLFCLCCRMRYARNPKKPSRHCMRHMVYAWDAKKNTCHCLTYAWNLKKS